MIKIITIIGARPQFIKAASVFRAINQYNREADARNQIKEIILHTGQHFDSNMSDTFFEELEIPLPDYNLGINSTSHGAMTGRMLEQIEQVLLKEKPDCAMVYGDTDSTLAGALAAAKLHVPVAHVEAGLRSFNRRMPEEINRVVTDQLSSILFCPTETAVKNLKAEGFTNIVNEGMLIDDKMTHLRESLLPPGNSKRQPSIVVNVGDVMYDSIIFNKELAGSKSRILERPGLLPNSLQDMRDDSKSDYVKDYCLVTIHRAENADEPSNLIQILEGLKRIASKGTQVIVPLHPRTQNRIKEFGLEHFFDFSIQNQNSSMIQNPQSKIQNKKIYCLDPLGYLDMLQLETHAEAILTDSGGVQKEAFLLEIPCITLRNETEWVETVASGWNILTGADIDRITDAFSRVLDWNGEHAPFQSRFSENLSGTTHNRLSSCPYGDGNSSGKIVAIMSKIMAT